MPQIRPRSDNILVNYSEVEHGQLCPSKKRTKRITVSQLEGDNMNDCVTARSGQHV